MQSMGLSPYKIVLEDHVTFTKSYFTLYLFVCFIWSI